MFNQIIVSVVSEIPRSTGDFFAGATSTVVNTINATIVNEEEFYTLANTLMANSGTRDRVGAMSLDGLFVPYTLYYEDTGVLPKWTRPTSTGVNSYLLNPFNSSGIFGSGNNPNGVADTGTFNKSLWNSSGHTINNAMTLNRNATESSISTGLHPASTHFGADYYTRGKVELVNIRGIALRSPLILSGIGTDLSGNPVPGSGGLFSNDAFTNPSLWKTGPVDLRWDQDRGVWTSPKGGDLTIRFRIVASYFCGECYVDARVISVPFGVSVSDLPDVDEANNNAVRIYDRTGRYFNEPPEDLVNRIGYAVYMQPLEDGPCPDTIFPSWECISLPCNEVTCD